MYDSISMKGLEKANFQRDGKQISVCIGLEMGTGDLPQMSMGKLFRLWPWL